MLDIEVPEGQRPVLIVVKNDVPLDKLTDRSDAEVPGVYLIAVKGTLTDQEAASVALDTFHGDVAIDTLDDFTISAIDPRTGNTLCEADDAEAYAHVDEGDLIGKISGNPNDATARPRQKRKP